MRELKGLAWGQLTDDEQREMLLTAYPVDYSTCDMPKESTDCIVDFENGLSVAGHYEKSNGEDIVSIDDDAILYDAAE